MVQVTLALEAEEFITVHNVLLVEHIRIAQSLLFMVKVYKVRRALRYLSSILK
jgi:hypothetical protein